jgi:hypothetical protein
MSKLNLAKLAQNEITKNEAQKTRGGVDCICSCPCTCPPDYRIDIKLADLLDNRDFILNY